ncbi:MAG: hypothetical protein IOD12_13335 [Silvanigrellales bacterium]|nr:hypothetical protein [Silvanigrellales bacterium]
MSFVRLFVEWASVAAIFPFVAACTHAPKGYRLASPHEVARLSDWENRLAKACAPTGSFLAEVAPHAEGRTGLSFQMEGVWSGDGDAFEAQFLSPLGEAWGQFTLAGAGGGSNEARYGNAVGTAQKAALQTFIDTLATIGAPNLRRMACGHGLIQLQDARVYRPQSADAQPHLNSNTWLIEGNIPAQGATLSVETTVAHEDGSLGAPIASKMSAVVKAGLWGAQQGSIDWEGTLATKGAPSPKRLRVQRSGQEGATLTFLEFE